MERHLRWKPNGGFEPSSLGFNFRVKPPEATLVFRKINYSTLPYFEATLGGVGKKRRQGDTWLSGN
jgi:hypothetical protein